MNEDDYKEELEDLIDFYLESEEQYTDKNHPNSQRLSEAKEVLIDFLSRTEGLDADDIQKIIQKSKKNNGPIWLLQRQRKQLKKMPMH